MAGLGDLVGRADLSAVGKANSEGTKIEQTRAFAEVVVQAKLAKEFPRSMVDVFRRIEEAFELSPALLAASKYSFPRGGSSVTGYTIQFARAIAECVGNVHYSIKEMSREDKQSEILTYAWDLETNTMQTRSIIVPHSRDTRQGKKELLDDRDIYENNTNNGARRLRECILGVLPAAAVKKGEEVVENLLRKAFPLEKQKAYADENIKRYKKIGVTKAMLTVDRGNKPPEMWTKDDLAALAAHWQNIENQIMTVAEIFPDAKPPVIKPKGKSSAEVKRDLDASVEKTEPETTKGGLF